MLLFIKCLAVHFVVFAVLMVTVLVVAPDVLPNDPPASDITAAQEWALHPSLWLFRIYAFPVFWWQPGIPVIILFLFTPTFWTLIGIGVRHLRRRYYPVA